MRNSSLNINLDRLLRRLDQLAEIGAIDGGGVCRMALSEEDRLGRDLVVSWMKELGLDISTDRIGNVIAVRSGTEIGPPVLTGSHIDTVATGGRYDGNLGVLAGLEVIETLIENNITTRLPVAVGFFTNEEGARYAPDMMGSAVHQGAQDVDEMLQVVGIDGTVLADELDKSGYAGDASTGDFRAHCFVELHIEQGPILDTKGIDIGAVDGVQGISWNEYRLTGTSNHAGTTPIDFRNDAGYVAAAISVEARRLAQSMGGNQVATVGVTQLTPNLINVIAKTALITVDLRNTDELLLQQAEQSMSEFISQLCEDEGVECESRVLARFEPVDFDLDMVKLIADKAESLGYRVNTMASGAGHDAQMFAPNCPTAMIFVPSRGGVSHNVNEFTEPEQLRAGADVLLQVMLAKSGLA